MMGEGAPLTRSIASGLSALGYATAVVPDANEAWRALAKTNYDVVILEVTDVAEGCLASRILRRWRVPIVVISHSPDPRAEISSYQAGADLFLKAPCDIQELAARLEGLIRRAEWDAHKAPDSSLWQPSYG